MSRSAAPNSKLNRINAILKIWLNTPQTWYLTDLQHTPRQNVPNNIPEKFYRGGSSQETLFLRNIEVCLSFSDGDTMALSSDLIWRDCGDEIYLEEHDIVETICESRSSVFNSSNWISKAILLYSLVFKYIGTFNQCDWETEVADSIENALRKQGVLPAAEDWTTGCIFYSNETTILQELLHKSLKL